MKGKYEEMEPSIYGWWSWEEAKDDRLQFHILFYHKVSRRFLHLWKGDFLDVKKELAAPWLLFQGSVWAGGDFCYRALEWTGS